MLIAEADYPFLDILWTIIIVFAWMAWFWIAITIFADVFRRKDIGGGKKALWCVFVIIVPFLGVLIYLLANHDGMADRNVKQLADNQAAFDDYVRKTAGGGGGAAAEIAEAKKLLDEPFRAMDALTKGVVQEDIELAKKLLDDGTINQAEFDAIKASAVGTTSG